MFVVQPVRDRNITLVPPIIARFFSTDQKNGDATWIERIENPIRLPAVLDSQLAHVRKLRTRNAGGIWKWQMRPNGFQQPDDRRDFILGTLGQLA